MTPLSSGLRPLVTLVLFLVGVLGGGWSAYAQMPDMKQMSGIPRPVDDLPNGSVSVRLIRGDMSKNIANHPVEMHIGSSLQTVTTDAEGRAQFDNVAPGTPVKFVAVVDGERLESQEFPAPARGGVRLLLVATDPDAEKQTAAEPATPAVTGAVAIGGESRIILEPNEENVLVYYVLDIVNSGQAPVNPQTPFTFSLQSSAVGTAVIQGSSPLASSDGRDITVRGPFPPGSTQLQVAAEYPISGGAVEISQAFPAAMQEVVVIAKKIGGMTLSSPQLERVQETVSEGTVVMIGAGKSVAAGTPITLSIAGLPFHSSVPRTVTMVLAVVIILAGVWAAASTGDPADRQGERRQLIARREKLFQELVRLENDHRRGRVDGPRYAARREELLQSLEHIYGALDDDETGPEPANRPGVAA